MNNKLINTIGIIIILIIGISGLYMIHDATYGKSIEGTRGFLEATHHTQITKKALEMDIDQDEAITKLEEIFKKEKRVCVTYINTRSRAVTQEYIRYEPQVRNMMDIIAEESNKKKPTWKIIDVDNVPCKAIEEIVNVQKPILK